MNNNNSKQVEMKCRLTIKDFDHEDFSSGAIIPKKEITKWINEIVKKLQQDDDIIFCTQRSGKSLVVGHKLKLGESETSVFQIYVIRNGYEEYTTFI